MYRDNIGDIENFVLLKDLADNVSALFPANDASTFFLAGNASTLPPASDVFAFLLAVNTSVLFLTSGISVPLLFNNISASLPTSNTFDLLSENLEDTTTGRSMDLINNINYLIN